MPEAQHKFIWMLDTGQFLKWRTTTPLFGKGKVVVEVAADINEASTTDSQLLPDEVNRLLTSPARYHRAVVTTTQAIRLNFDL